LGRRADPVTEVAETVDPVELMQAGRADVVMTVAGEDAELVCVAVRTRGGTGGDPCECIGFVVAARL
jgi:hypothetical protein